MIGPAADGGYYLIGLNRLHEDLFREMPWSQSGLFSATCERVSEKDLSLSLLPEWYDVDDMSALRRLAAEEHLAELAPRTFQLLPELSISMSKEKKEQTGADKEGTGI